MSRKPDAEYYIRNDDPKLLAARVFIGNLPTMQMRREELENIFNKYGKLLAVSMMKGFGFVQYETSVDAKRAVMAERGLKLHGYELDIKMAAEGRRKDPMRDRDRDRDRFDDRGDRRMSGGRDRSPIDDRRDFRRGSSPGEYRRGPPGRDDRGPPPGRDDRGPPPGRDDRGPPGGDMDRFPPSRFPPRRDPYSEGPPPASLIPPFDCTIVSMTKDQRAFAEIVESKIKQAGLETDFIILSNEAMLAKALDDITRQKIPYAVVCSAQNESHRSLTVNILLGTPQEHRNMPLEDAISLIARSFEKFKEEIRAKMGAPAGPPPAAAPRPAPKSMGSSNFVAPHPKLAYLMNLMADGRELTLEELDQVFTYVFTRRNREREARGMPTEKVAPDGAVVATPAPVQTPVTVPTQPAASDQEKTILEQQAQLQAKILSILQGPTSSTTPAPASRNPYDSPLDSLVAAARPAASVQSRALDTLMNNSRGVNSFGATAGRPTAPQPQAGSTGQASGGINFDNPTVQKALDNLIQSGPNLLRNINSSNSNEQSTASQYSRMGGAGAYRY